MIVTRTDPNAPKHAGLTYFIVDMKAPGVEVRPIKQINGASGFNTVFFSDVRVPDSNRLGAVGDGWRVAITTLMNERVAIGAGGGAGRFRDLLKLARDTRRNGRPAIEDTAVRQKLADFYIRSKDSSTPATARCRRSRAARRRVPRAPSARRSVRRSGRRWRRSRWSCRA